jgi:hypothetical protein
MVIITKLRIKYLFSPEFLPLSSVTMIMGAIAHPAHTHNAHLCVYTPRVALSMCEHFFAFKATLIYNLLKCYLVHVL